MSVSNKCQFPRWFQMTCCVIPLSALLAVSVGLAGGVSVNPFVTFTLAALAWRVIAQVLGIDQALISLVMPNLSAKKLLASSPEDD